MNLGTLSTLARYRPPNLTHLIFDNESLLSVGGFPSATGTGTDLAGVAREAGVEHVTKADTVEALEEAYAVATGRPGLSAIHSKVEAVGPPSFAMDIGLLETASSSPGTCGACPRNSDGNPLLGRGIWSVRPIRAGRGSKFARAMRWRS